MSVSEWAAELKVAVDALDLKFQGELAQTIEGYMIDGKAGSSGMDRKDWTVSDAVNAERCARKVTEMVRKHFEARSEFIRKSALGR